MTITVKQAAKRLGVSQSLVYALVAAGRLKYFRVGLGRGTIRIEEESLADVKRVEPAVNHATATAGLKHLSLS